MTRAEIIEYLYDNNVHGDLKIEDMADDLAEPHWIPCSITTNLPDHEVLCCDIRGNMLIGYLCTDEGSDTGFLAESDGECLVDCVAWREKPEPWYER